MIKKASILLGAILVGTGLLSACSAPAPAPTPTPTVSRAPTAKPTATPTPSPTVSTPPPISGPSVHGAPALADLILTPDGMATLTIGQPIDPAMATWDPKACMTPENEMLLDTYASDDPVWAAYVPTYPAFTFERDGYEYTRYPFNLSEDDNDHLRWLRVQTPDISTDRGIRIGSSEAEVLAAYPGAVRFDKGLSPYTSYNVDGVRGRLVIEVTGRDFDMDAPREVWTMVSTRLDDPLYSMGGGDGGGYCNF